jgi:hypothetical protein
VCGSEGVVNVEVAQTSEITSEPLVVRPFFLMKPKVFQKTDFTHIQVLYHLFGGPSHAILRKSDGALEEFFQVRNERFEGKLRHTTTAGPTQVSHQYRFQSPVKKFPKGRQGRFHPPAVGDLPLLGEGDVQVDPDQSHVLFGILEATIGFAGEFR